MENLEKGMDRISEALSQLKTTKKIKRIRLNNTITHQKQSVPVDSSLSIQMRDALVSEMESHLSFENYFEWNANINGVIVQLRTNVAHLYDFWVENWYPAQLEADLEPHGIIYAVDGIPGREPRAFYNSETKTAVLVNADNYSPLRSLALGMVMDVSERVFNVYGVRGMSADLDGNGLILLGPKGTKKTELYFSLLQDDRLRLHSNELVFIRSSGSVMLAVSAERKLYLPTNAADVFPRLAELFDNSKCENVIVRKDDCTNEKCLQLDDCRLDRGSPFCYTAAKDAYAMLDPYWIQGTDKHVKRTALGWIFILRSDRVSPPFVEIETEDALRILEYGESLGSRSDLTTSKSHAFFNPHLLMTTADRLESQRNFFQRLLDNTKCYLFNSGVATSDDIIRIITGEPPADSE
jgi:hypothetical protein